MAWVFQHFGRTVRREPPHGAPGASVELLLDRGIVSRPAQAALGARRWPRRAGAASGRFRREMFRRAALGRVQTTN